MKELTSYITEKLDINKVNLRDMDFPIDGSITDMAEFLKNYKFEEVLDSYDYESVNDIFPILNNCKNKCYMTDIDTYHWIRICDTSRGKISKSNPCIFISYETKNYDLECPHSIDNHISKEECLKYLKKFNIE